MLEHKELKLIRDLLIERVKNNLPIDNETYETASKALVEIDKLEYEFRTKPTEGVISNY